MEDKMKITVIGMIKNSADIIESFIRGNGLFADNFILIDNGSTDNTMAILNSLSDEGFQIDVFSDDENAYFQSAKMNMLIREVVDNYDVDWIVPLDDDEILAAEDNGNIRDIISGLDRKKAYYAYWRIYTPTEKDDKSDICVISRQKYIYSDSFSTQRKIFFNKEIAVAETFNISMGNHEIFGVDAEKLVEKRLVIAHFPVRSDVQIISKALVGWTNYLALPNRVEGNGAQWKVIYDVVKKTFSVPVELMQSMCRLYLDTSRGFEDLTIEYKPLSIDTKAFEIKYTRANEINPMQNYFNNTEQLAVAYAELLKEKMERDN